MISYAEIKLGKILDIDNDPMLVIWTSGVVKKQRQKPHNTVKLRNLRTKSTVEKTFTQADKIKEAELETKEIKYLFKNPKNGETMFCDIDNPGNRFSLSDEVVDNATDYLIENSVVTAQIFNDEIIALKLPNKVNLKVAEAPPNIKGNTSAGGNKVVVLETGLKVTTPLFINTGDTIRVNTETGVYSERV